MPAPSEPAPADFCVSAKPFRKEVRRGTAFLPAIALGLAAVLGHAGVAMAEDAPRPAVPPQEEGSAPAVAPPADIATLASLARTGNPEALYRLSLLGLTGKLGKVDGPQVERWLNAAFQRGHEDAGFVRATMYLKGFHVPPDAVKAAALFRQLAERGHDAAQNALGQMYAQGTGVEQDYGQAIRWLSAASEKGNAAAQANLALMYVNGNGVAPDTQRAFNLMSAAAKAGRAGAQHNLGWMYQHGVGVAPDPARAFEWYRRAAELGESRSQYNIGLLYLSGKGVDADPVAAVKWLVLAASTARDPDTKEKAQSTLNKVTPALKSGDFHEGAQAARMWLLRRQWAKRSDRRGPD